jgi:hypothetical protein
VDRFTISSLCPRKRGRVRPFVRRRQRLRRVRIVPPLRIAEVGGAAGPTGSRTAVAQGKAVSSGIGRLGLMMMLLRRRHRE